MLWPITIPLDLTRLLLVTLGLTLISRLQLALPEEPRLTNLFRHFSAGDLFCVGPTYRHRLSNNNNAKNKGLI